MIDYLKNAKKKTILTKFLSMEEQKILENSKKNYLYSNEIHERKRAFISSNQIDGNDFNISVLKIEYNKNFYELTHPMVLGALTGLGITRECIGDIIISDDIYIIVIAEMEEFIIKNLTSIDKASVEVIKSNSEELENIEVNNYYEDNIIVSSMRLDVIVSTITNYSREKAKTYILQKNVKLNGIVKTNIDENIKVGDLLSIHRFGRTIIIDIVRKTKKRQNCLIN
jgi:RNA-binding protein YlmH